MKNWLFVLYKAKANLKLIPPDIIENVKPYIQSFHNKEIPIILSLGHLAYRTGINYTKLHSLITHRDKHYKYFNIRKHSGGYRTISVPAPELLLIQKWININILSKSENNPYSFAFTKNKSIKNCAENHIGCKWLIKIDIRHFFDSISEIKVYKYFYSLGYSKLVSLELARLCTVTIPNDYYKYSTYYKRNVRVQFKKNTQHNWKSWDYKKYKFYREKKIGFLPQGAPTSPMLANIIVKSMDYEIAEFVEAQDLIYTRYADDLFISSNSDSFNKAKAKKIISKIYKILYKYGFEYNNQKTKIFGPGSRKIILGLLVTDNKVGITKKLKSSLECQLHYLIKDPITHSKTLNIENIYSYCEHLKGYLSYIYDVDNKYYEYLKKKGLIPDWNTLISN